MRHLAGEPHSVQARGAGAVCQLDAGRYTAGNFWLWGPQGAAGMGLFLGSQKQLSYAVPLAFAVGLHPDKLCHGQLPIALDPLSLSLFKAQAICAALSQQWYGNSICVMLAAGRKAQV